MRVYRGYIGYIGLRLGLVGNKGRYLGYSKDNGKIMQATTYIYIYVGVILGCC